MAAETADTPDIVERLRAMALGWPSLLTEAADTILALRAAQSPQARDEGGAVEGPGLLAAADEAERRATAWTTSARGGLGEMFANQSASDMMTLARDLRRRAAPSPPTDAINTAEGDAGLAQRGETATGLMRPPSPPQAPQDVAKLMTAARRATGLVFSNPYPRASAAAIKQMERAETEAWDALAAALTPRELTDEEAERGAEAFVQSMRDQHVSLWGIGSKEQALVAIRAAYRAIRNGL